MFAELKVFDIRKPDEEDYQVPALDVVNDNLPAVPEVFPPGAPVLVGLSSVSLTWEPVLGATSYQIENLLTGTIWTVLAGGIPAPAQVRIEWDGYAWHIQQLVNGIWVDQYISNDDIPSATYTPADVTVWEAVNGALPVPTVVPGDLTSSGGMIVSGAGTTSVNAAYGLSGLSQGGLHSYAGPEEISYAFTPTVNAFYRVRAFNSAGSGPASNNMQWTTPPYDCGGNPSNVADLVWTVDTNSGTVNDGYTNIVTSLSASGATVSFSCAASTIASGGSNPNSLIDVVAQICNPSNVDKTLTVVLSGVSYSIHSVQGANMFCNAYITVNGNTSYIYNATVGQNSHSGTESGGAIASPLTFVVPAQSVVTIEVAAQCETDLGDGTLTDSSTGQATLTFSLI